ncbi:hypothetical protein Tco_1024343 [Tanacetum coccineum]
MTTSPSSPSPSRHTSTPSLSPRRRTTSTAATPLPTVDHHLYRHGIATANAVQRPKRVRLAVTAPKGAFGF